MRISFTCYLLLLLCLPLAAEAPSWSPNWLAFSDHPEKVKKIGQLYDGSLIALRPVRFQYYHLGEIDGGAYLKVTLFNPNPSSSRVHLRSAVGGPDGDYFAAGHQNNVEYLKAWGQRQGRVIEVPPGWTTVAVHPLPKGKVVSGTQEMTLLGGKPVHFGLFALSSPDSQKGLSLLSDAQDVHARGVYPVANEKVIRSHRVGQEDTFAAFGAVRQRNLWESKELRGDYGVLYEFEFHLSNPTAHKAPVKFIFNPRGGAATGTFWIAGRGLVEVENTKAYQTPEFFQLELKPGEERVLRMWTLPEGASSYPVRVVMSSR